MHERVAAAGNFLVPNGTFIFEWIVFVLVLVFVARKILPRITAMIEKRQETIRAQFEEAERARTEAEQARTEYQEALAETRREITKLREQAQSEGAQILDDFRQRAQQEYDERITRLQEQLAAERQQVLMSMRREIGELAVTLSEKIVHDTLRNEERQRKLVDDFISGVGATVAAEAEASR
jgi:F-type H+-transporting ATPase subunit b